MSIDKNFAYSLPCTVGKQFKPFHLVNVPASVLVSLLNIDNKGSVLKRSQREVNMKRAKDFAKYLVNNYKRFYIIPTIIGVVVSKKDKKPEFEEVMEGARVGLLHISMDSSIKLFDGQHRSVGIDFALEMLCDELAELGFDLENVDVPIMLYTNLTLKERQLGFCDINQNLAKPQQSISDAFNTRDPLPCLARYITENCVAFKDLVDMEHNTITKKSEKYFPLKAIKDINQILLGLSKEVKEISDSKYQLANEFWTTVSRAMGWGGLAFSDTSAEEFRNTCILTHVATLKAVAVAGNIAMNHYGSLEAVQWDKLEELNYSRDLGTSDFTGRIIDDKSGNMSVNKTSIDLAANKLLTTLGVPLSEARQKLEDHYFGSQSMSDDSGDIDGATEQAA
ncbi:DNA sulfur modification protein DndB [Vibrio parahaemolyticus]|uniref:DGQHR domain-containing protein n=1 Tax=Vibrio parahaemolyticus TaxID=670 RepID=UPI00084A7A8C|nr:DGQHR domain-containing protein [Vibrio parahaemolyticus]EGQ9299017.1 DGQHR domain-containing protein [Vibrio parahaemolyticus]EGR0689101.1 DGQHR domain-containing protein [Vibrio parahaemolyticus]EJO3863012.1 DNA sulfur modification protein DndB [Vibrio parahaemolyticus]EJR4295990.1 DNA sulfur modification protein DndB [Vibrio parahaemolyticus]ODY86747.1 hypothetical protein BBM32_23470 [Vibrio parahaemolyticus]